MKVTVTIELLDQVESSSHETDVINLMSTSKMLTEMAMNQVVKKLELIHDGIIEIPTRPKPGEDRIIQTNEPGGRE